MKLVKKEEKTIYTYEITQLEKLILLGILSDISNERPIELDDAFTEVLNNLMNGQKSN